MLVRRRARRPPTRSPRPARCRRTAPTPGSRCGRAACPASAMPTPTGSPWPSEPVAVSTHGSRRGVGCPSSRLPSLRKVSSSSSSMAPAALYAAYSSGEACPLERTKRSLPGCCGAVEVVAQVVGEQYGHQVGGGHGGRRMPGARGGGGAHAVHAQLLRQFGELTAVHESPSVPGGLSTGAVGGRASDGGRGLRPSARAALRARSPAGLGRAERPGFGGTCAGRAVLVGGGPGSSGPPRAGCGARVSRGLAGRPPRGPRPRSGRFAASGAASSAPPGTAAPAAGRRWRVGSAGVPFLGRRSARPSGPFSGVPAPAPAPATPCPAAPTRTVRAPTGRPGAAVRRPAASRRRPGRGCRASRRGGSRG